ncbi:oligosaccharide flippase family protein [Clostridium sp. HCP1S3_B4]|uniref:oligosaccharide flippase family protein n=1 Tax=unclassified Clostridium TaxID=2614128 RepID=UPI003F8989CF
MSNKRSKRLLKDIILFAIASFGPKLLSFFLVPLYTSCLTPEIYGISDLLATITSLLLPILMVDISDAIILYTIEGKNEESKNQPLKFGTEILLVSSFGLGLILLGISALSYNNLRFISYLVYIFLSYFTFALYNNLLAYLRGQDKVNSVVIAGILNSLVSLLSNVILILYFNMGLYGILISSVLGTFVANIYIVFKINFFTILKNTNNLNKADKIKMISYSVPLIFTGLAWWVNSSSDRLFISAFASVSINGIYAIANKIPTILSACHSIVYQAMQLSVFKEIHSDDKDEYLKSLYSIYSFIMQSICSILIFFDKVLAKILFKEDFYIAWKYSPALLISIVFFSIAGYLTTIYAAEKETKLIAKATIIGAIVNCVLNILFIPKFKLFGAVIATVIGYFLIWLIMALGAKKIINVDLPLKDNIVCGLLLIFQWVSLLILDNSYLIQFIIIVLFFMLNRKTIIKIFNIANRMIFNKIKKKY